MPIFKYTFFSFSLIPQKTFLSFFFFNLHGKFKLKHFKISSFTQWILKKNKMNWICVYWSLKFWFQIIQEKKYYATWFFEKIKTCILWVQFILLADKKQKLIPASLEKELKLQNWLSSMLPLKCACLSVEKKKQKKLHFFSLHLTSQFLFIL